MSANAERFARDTQRVGSLSAPFSYLGILAGEGAVS